MILDDVSGYYWKYYDLYESIFAIDSVDDETCRVIAKMDKGLDSQERKANGRLMGFAPDMFRVLRDLRVELWDMIATHNAPFDKRFLDCVDNLDKFIRSIDREDEI